MQYVLLLLQIASIEYTVAEKTAHTKIVNILTRSREILIIQHDSKLPRKYREDNFLCAVFSATVELKYLVNGKR